MGRGRGGGGRGARPCRNGSYGCNGNRCMRCGADNRDARREQGGGWTPTGSQNPDVGVIEGTDHVVSFKTGGPNGDETLIADGDYSKGDGTGAKDARAAFNAGHDHYGSAQEGGWIDQVRGFFSG